MNKLSIFTMCFISIFIIVSAQVYAARSYTSKTADNTVEVRDKVIVTVSEPITKTQNISLGLFKAQLAREKVLRDGYIASVTAMEAELILLQAEADKVVLKIPDPELE